MWLLTAVGPVHGQLKFTFALEQRKTYSVGRDKSCDIRYENRYVKPLQGSVIVGDWDPTSPTQQPEIRWKSEPNKKGVYPPFKTIVPHSPSEIGSLHKSDYATDEIPEGTPGCFLNDNGGMGIELGEGCWFTIHWQALSLCYDRMKDEPEGTRDTLRRYCIPWSPKFEEVNVPDLVISSSFRASAECNNAVIHGVRIVTPAYLEILLQRFISCWKKVADSQDSFALPPPESSDFRPELDSGLPNVRSGVDCWEPDARRKTLFAGWKIMGLKNKTVPIEKRWLLAMGADYTDIDISRTPPQTPEAFAEQLRQWIAQVDAEGSRDQALVVHFMRVKEELAKAHLDFNTIVGTACQGLDIVVCSGNVTWGAVKQGGVQAYIDAVRPDKAGPSTSKPTRAQPTVTPAPLVRPASPVSQTIDMPSSSAFQPQSQLAIPSTFPEETQAIQPVAPTSAQRGTTPESQLPESSGVRRPLKKRAPRKIDLFADDLSVIPETFAPMDLDPSPPVSQEQREPATQASQSARTQTNSMAPSSKLKRRAGPETQRSQFNFGFDASFDADQKAAEEAAEIRELYEKTKAESARGYHQPPPNKKQKLVSVSTGADSLDSNEPASLARRHSHTEPDIMGLNDEEELEEIEDPIQRTLRKAREAKTQGFKPQLGSMAPPPPRQPRRRSPSEEPEPVEITKKSKLSQTRPVQQSQIKTASSQTDEVSAQPTQDTAFLQAITKANKSKKVMDDLDREFNNLKIPKPSGRTKDAEVTTTGINYDHPDWNLVDDFDDGMRGNFIQIVKKDLFRKDKPLDRYVGVGRERLDNGGPNFKKFKKKSVVRHPPIRLVLAGPTLEDAEMGEPYWPTETTKYNKRSQASQMVGSVVEEDEMPLLPSTRKRILKDDDDSGEEQSTLTRHKGFTQSMDTQDTARPARRARATSVASVLSDLSTAPSTRTRKAPAKSTKSSVKQKKAAVVVEDSEDEVAEEMERTPAPTGSTRSTRGAPMTVTSTLRGDPNPSGGTRIPGTSLPASSHATRSHDTKTVPASGRRRLLDVDEDDGDTAPSKGIQKKRRMR